MWIMGVLAGVLPLGTAVGQPSGEMPAVFDSVGVTEQLGTNIPQDLAFRDASGAAVQLGDYLDGERPVLLNLVYHDCPMLCNLVLDGMTNMLRELAWTPGGKFEIVTVSFSPREGPELAARQKAHYLDVLGKPGAAAGWHFLTGSEEAIQALAAAIGFRYRWIEEQQQFAHPAALIFLSGDGKITRYLYGLEYKAADVRIALTEASEGKVGSAIDQAILYCFQYDPQANSYVLHAVNFMKLGGLLTMVVLGGMLVIFWRRERQRQKEAPAV